ncbi:hypothetical protein ABZY09_30485 [Streptomyces sp. NPDC002928]|uniref:hypothetical protein n=1 Tax=Streptomyces sp. NPDC002928 TaxID=3154440 RepID=UPI0033A8D47A
MDDHRGLPHDLPDYVPNWPIPVTVKAKVMKGRNGWTWGHNCPRRPGVALGWPQPTQPAAFEAALKHARGCW